MMNSFVAAPPVLGVQRTFGLSRSSWSASPRVLRASRMSADAPAPQGPVVPEGFKIPEPRRGYVRPEALSGILARGLGTALRAGAGAVVLGYTVRARDGRLVEFSSVLPETRPALPLVLFEFEACPFCKKVREALCMLDLDVIIKPCPRGGTAFRKYAVENFGKSQFPYLIDPNTDFSGYESGDIVEYLFATYGGATSTVPFILGPVGSAFAGFSGLSSGGRGARRERAVVPAPQPLELWGYEPSPFSRIVRERLAELEIPYLLHPTARGSANRQKLKDMTEIIQTPYLVDPNTGINMFESVDIVAYLSSVYGPEAPGAVADPSTVYRSEEFERGPTDGNSGSDKGEDETESGSASESSDGGPIGGGGLNSGPPGSESGNRPVGTFNNGYTTASRPSSPTASTNFTAEGDGGAADSRLNPSDRVDPVLEDFCQSSPDADECRTYDS
jgi:glutathione S-transferase